ncbi:MAG: phosphate acyltransferase [Rhizobiaceae bacterium]
MSANPFLSKLDPVCPEHLLTLAKQNPPARTAIVRAGAPLPMQAAKAAFDKGIMEPVFVGEQAEIQSEAENLDWDISNFQIINTTGEKEAAREGALLGNRADVDVIMKGNLHTDTFMGALIKRETGIRTEKRLVHVFYITDPVKQHPLIICDGAVNVTPDLKTRQTAIVTVDALARRTGIARPKIAILSATESAIPSVPSSMEAKELADWASENVKSSDVRGPLALDLVLSQKSAETKGLIDDPVAGKADAIIVPDIVSGNAVFKSLVYLGGGCAAGIVLGGKIPVLLTSRADPPAARLASAALASIMRE